MAMIPAKCTNCGANIQVDETKEAGICESCGTAFITEKAINNYNIKTSLVNINGENINILQTDIDEQIAAAKKLAKEDLIKDASDLFDELIKRYPHEYKVWWEYSLFEYQYRKRWFESQFEAYKKARALSDEEHLTVIDKYVQSEKNRIYDEGKNIIDFCKNPDYSMLDSIYVRSESVPETFKLQYENNNLSLYHYNYKGFSKYWYNKEFYTDLTNIEYDIYDNRIVGILTFAGGSQLGDKNYIGLKAIGIYIQAINDGKITVKNEITDLNRINELNEPKPKGCYIATAVYGSYDCPPVWTLRRYRDETLASTWYGRAFIHTYYAISPTLVKWFGHTSWFKKMWRGKLDKIVNRLQNDGVEGTPYEDKNWK